MGRAKAWLPWFDGRTLIEHVVERIRPAVDEVLVVTSVALDLPALDARVVRDREPERGPLAGLRDGLAATSAAHAFVTATDAPFLTTEYVDGMLSRRAACAPVEEGHVQVLSAVYPGEGAAVAERLLEEGRGRPRDLLEALDYEALDANDPALASAPWKGFNTPDAYLDAVRGEDPDARCRIEFLGRAALASKSPNLEVPVGTLGDVLAQAARACDLDLDLVEGEQVARGHLVSLGGRDLVRDLSLPVGPDERISVLDAQAGG